MIFKCYHHDMDNRFESIYLLDIWISRLNSIIVITIYKPIYYDIYIYINTMGIMCPRIAIGVKRSSREFRIHRTFSIIYILLYRCRVSGEHSRCDIVTHSHTHIRCKQTTGTYNDRSPAVYIKYTKLYTAGTLCAYYCLYLCCVYRLERQ